MKRRYAGPAVLLLGLAACTPSSNNDPAPTPSASIPALLQQIDHDIAALPGVEKAATRYTNTFDDAGDVSADITLKSQSDLAAVREEAIRLYWTSKLRPIGAVGIFWTFTREHTTKDDTQQFNMYDDSGKTLKAKYGPRPV